MKYSYPGCTSTGRICPGTRVANATSPGAPHARYSVMNRLPPPATRFNTPNNPPPPIICVCVVILIELDIHDNSPASEMIASFGCSRNSRTGIVVPTMRLCIRSLLGVPGVELAGPDTLLGCPAFQGEVYMGFAR